MKLSLALQGRNNQMRDAYEAFPEWPRTHVIGGHGGQFGRWTPERDQFWNRALWPHMKNHRVAPDRWAWPGRWRRHEQYVIADVIKWHKEIRARPGERITFNEEIWPALWLPDSDWFSYGKTRERHMAFLEEVYWRTQSNTVAQVAKMMEDRDKYDGAVRFTDQIEFGCSGPFFIRNYTDEQIEWMQKSPTLGMDYDSPQIRCLGIESDVDSFERWTKQIYAAPRSMTKIPLIGPFYPEGFTAVPRHRLEAMHKFLADRGITEADVWINVAASSKEDFDNRIERIRPVLDVVREVFGVEAKA